jgi:hypothetical protein
VDLKQDPVGTHPQNGEKSPRNPENPSRRLAPRRLVRLLASLASEPPQGGFLFSVVVTIEMRNSEFSSKKFAKSSGSPEFQLSLLAPGQPRVLAHT